jgi:hypothetical protein
MSYSMSTESLPQPAEQPVKPEALTLRSWIQDAVDWGVSNEDLNWNFSLNAETGEIEDVTVVVASGKHAEAVNDLIADYWRSVMSSGGKAEGGQP